MSRIIGVNTLVCQNEIENGKKKQWEYFADFNEIGFSLVEVRREYFNDFNEELEQTNKKAQELNMTVFYSIPDALFVKGQLNPHLTDYLEEAKKLGSIQVKLTIGDFREFSTDIIHLLNQKLDRFKGITISIENDQTVKGGSAEALSSFIMKAHGHKLPLQLMFDTGNFAYIGESPELAAHLLEDKVNYIHIKNIAIKAENKIEFALFETGDLDLKAVLQAFKPNVVAAIEYPCASLEELAQQFHLIQSL